MSRLSARRFAAVLVALVAGMSQASAITDVQKLTAASSDARVVIEWANPAAEADLQGVLVLARAGAPVGDVPTTGAAYLQGDTIGASTVRCNVSSPVSSCTIGGLTNGTSYYFKLFTRDTSLNYSAGVDVAASPRASSDVRWSFATAASALNPTGAISGRSVVGIGNDGLLHRMSEADGTRGNWTPPLVGGAVQSRPMVGDLNPGGAPDDTAFSSAQNGFLYRYSMADDAALDAARNVVVDAGCPGGMLQSGPVIIVDAFDGNSNNNDNVVIQATRCGDVNGDGTLNDNKILLYSHDLSTLYATYPSGAGSLGISNATPYVLYRDSANNVVYVPVHDAGGPSLLVLEIDSTPAFQVFSTISGIGDIDAPPAMFRKGTDPLMVVGNTTGNIYLYLALVQSAGPGTPLVQRDTLNAGDGGVKAVAASTAIPAGGNLFDHWVVWSTDTKVHGVMVPPNGAFESSTVWHANIASASAPLVLRNVRTPGDVLVYVGGANGTLYELNATNGSVLRSWSLAPGTTVGDPTFDYNDGVHQGIVVGTTAGTIHWVPIN
ncbi:MAG: hypothetical protein U0V87_16640 [Acidobacteriota bacterium]